MINNYVNLASTSFAPIDLCQHPHLGVVKNIRFVFGVGRFLKNISSRYFEFASCDGLYHVRFIDGTVIDNISCIERSGGFKQNNLALRIGDRFVLNATRNNA